MKYYSELTGKIYDTVELFEQGEAEYKAKQAEKEAKLAEKKARADEVTAAYQAVKDAEKKYFELRNQFIKDYGSFHMTYRSDEVPVIDFRDLFSTFFGKNFLAI